MRERRAGHFERTITLPTNVYAERTEATSEHGVLTLRLPKVEESRARSIPVRAGKGERQSIEAWSQTRPASAPAGSSGQRTQP